MTTVTGKLIGFAAPQRAEMRATLVDVTGEPAVGYVASVPGELVRPVAIDPDADGDWTIDLTANSLIVSQSGDTLWAIQEGRKRDGTPIVSYIAVPETGTWWVGDILADLSSTQTGDSTVVYLASAPGADGASAYEVAVANGFVGSEAEWLASLVGPPGDSGSGGGAVDSVNDLTGVVVLDAADVGADPAGAATAAQAAAVTAAATDATAKVTAHVSATDPHGDRAAASAALSTHESGTTSVHGITDTSALETISGAQAKADAAGTAAATDATAKVSTHTAATDPHGDRAAAASALTTHAADTTDVHGITDTSLLETTSGAQAKADTAQTAATSAAASDATAKVAAHTTATDPHGDRSYADGKLAKTANLSDLANTSTARTNLGLGGAALLGVGTDAGTVAAGDDSRIAGAAQKAQNLADLANAATARTNLGLGGAATLAVGTSAGTVAAGNDTRITGALPAAGGTVSGNLAVTGNALGEDKPATHGIAAWCYDPALAVNSTQLAAGTLYLVRVDIAAAVTATKIYWWVANTGSGATTNQNLVGLYDSSGTLLASANVDASFSTATLKTTTITSTPLTAGQFYWIGLLFNASVTPTLTRGSGWTGVETAANLGLAASAYRFAKNGTSRTALPSPLTPASNVGTDFAGPWAAVGA